MRFTTFTAFEDAFYFYRQAKGLPDIASSRDNRDRYSRVSILLSWVGLEEAIQGSRALLKQSGRLAGTPPAKLYDVFAYLQSILGLSVTPRTHFLRMRSIRNNIAHGQHGGGAPPYGPDEAFETFKFCFDAAQAIWPSAIWNPNLTGPT